MVQLIFSSAYASYLVSNNKYILIYCIQTYMQQLCDNKWQLSFTFSSLLIQLQEIIRTVKTYSLGY